MTLCEDELIIESSLHSGGISIHLEWPVGESHVQRHLDQSVLINPAWCSQGPLPQYILISLMSAHLHPATALSCCCQNVLACCLFFYHYNNLEAFIFLIWDIRPLTIREISINSFWYKGDCVVTADRINSKVNSLQHSATRTPFWWPLWSGPFTCCLCSNYKSLFLFYLIEMGLLFTYKYYVIIFKRPKCSTEGHGT